MATTEQLLRLLTDSSLLSADVLVELRARVAKAPGRIDPRSVTKWLVQQRLLTVDQALDFLDGRIPTAKAEPAPRQKIAGEELLLADDLEMVDDAPQPVDENLEIVDDDLEVVDENLEVVDDDLEIVEDSPSKASPARPAKTARGAAGPSSNVVRQPARSPAPRRAATLDPPADLLSGPPPGMPAPSLGGALLGGPMVTRIGKKKQSKANVWDSPLLLFGGGSLLGLVILGGVLYWAIGRQTGDEALRLAEADYQAGSYTQAVHKFDQYLKNYPTHTGAGTARVHRGLALMRQAIDNSSSDWTRALAASKQTLEEIARENEFPQARSELAALLPRMAQGLAEQARRNPNVKLVEQTTEALALVEKYVPRSLRPAEQLQEVEQSLALTRLELARGESLEKALKEIEAATAASRPSDAYEIRKQLLKVYPDLEQDAALQKALLAISQSEQDDVMMVAAPQAAMAAESEQAVTATVGLVTHTPGNVSGAEGVVLAHADGAVYGLDAATGHPAWRRYIGFDATRQTRLAQRQSTPHALVVDSVRREVICLAAADGTPVWRQSLGENTTASLLVLRDRVAAAMQDGRLLLTDLQSGDSAGYVQFPHRLTVAPATDPRQRHYYQLADHSNLYVVSVEDGVCQEVVYLGHEADSIRVPPLVVGKYLLVAENQGAASSLLRVFTTDDQGLNVQLVQSMPLEGHVHVQPQVTQSKTLVVITDRGTFYTFDIGAGKKQPLTQVASRPSRDDRPLVRFALARGAEFFVADNQLSKFDIQAAQGRLSPKWQENRGDVFLEPLREAGDCLIHVRRKAGIPGVAVAASKMSDGSLLWETHLAAPLAGDPLVTDQQAIVAANLAGGLYRLPAGELETSLVANGPEELASPGQSSVAGSPSAITSSGVAAFRIHGKQLIAVQPGGEKLKWRSLAVPGALSMGPVAAGEALLTGTRAGQVLLLDAASGRPVAEPFQPKLESGLEVQWRTPAVTDSGDILIADDHQRLFRLRNEPQPRAHLSVKKQKELPETIATRLAVAGELVYAATERGNLMAFGVEDLETVAEIDLAAPVAWGPYRVDENVLAATATGTLICLGEEQQPWRTELPHGALVGAPLAVDGRWVLAAKAGVLYSIAPADGSKGAAVEIGQPLASGPIALGKQLLVAGHDGVLLRVSPP